MPTGGGVFASGTNLVILGSVLMNEDVYVIAVGRKEILFNLVFSL